MMKTLLAFLCGMLLAAGVHAQDVYPGGSTNEGGGGTPDAHASTHESGGSDEIDVTGLTGASGLTDCGANGVLVRTALDTYTCRTVTSSDGSNTITNGDGASGNIDVVVDSAVFSRFSSGTGDVAATGSVGTFYAETDANSFYTYPSTDTEHWLLSIGAGVAANRFFFSSGTDVLSSLSGIDGELLTWGADGVPTTVAAGDSGQVLTSNGAGAAPTFQAAAGGAAFDPSSTVEIYEDFVGGSNTSAAIGETGVYFTAYSSGTVEGTAGIVSASGNVGWRGIEAVAADDSGGQFTWFPTADNYSNADIVGGNWNLETVVRTDASIIANTLVFWGWNTSTSVAYSSCIGIRFDTDVDSTFVFVVSSSSAGCDDVSDGVPASVEASTVTPAANTRYRLRIRSESSGVGGNPTIYFSVSDETEKTFCSSGCDDDLDTVPSGNLWPHLMFATRAASEVKQLDVDYMYLKMTGLTRY